MYYLLAIVTGLLLAIMVYFNGLLGASTTIYVGSVIFHAVGLFIFGFTLLLIGKTQNLRYKESIKPSLLALILPGVLGSFTIVLSNIALVQIGVTLMVGISLIGQVVTSMIIDTCGYLGKEKSSLTIPQGVGTGLMLSGVWLLLS